MHPSLAPWKRFWDEGTLAFVHQCGSPDPTRSHFDAQDNIETGTPGHRSTDDGFLGRALELLPPVPDPAFRAVALSANVSRALACSQPVLAVDSLERFALRGPVSGSGLSVDFESMYRNAVDEVLRGAGSNALVAVDRLRRRMQNMEKPRVPYPQSPLGRRLRELGALIRADLGLVMAFTDCGGWDTHVAQGASDGPLAARLGDLATAVAALAADVGPRWDDVTLVTLTEFGRCVKENGSRGTDHGHGAVMALLGGRIKGKTVHARWKDLSAANLFEGRDLPVTIDFREVMIEALAHALAIPRPQEVFPGFAYDPKKKLAIFRA
jgi:uncharacterized protein (DUF1501 family)